MLPSAVAVVLILMVPFCMGDAGYQDPGNISFIQIRTFIFLFVEWLFSFYVMFVKLRNRQRLTVGRVNNSNRTDKTMCNQVITF